MELNAPLMVHWEMTRSCNLKCLHCYQQDDSQKRNQVNQRNLFEIARKLVRSGVFQVTMTGGEPFLINSLRDIIVYFNQYGIKPQISTNGTILTPDIERWLTSVNVKIQISLDSHRSSVHDHLRQYPGALSTVLTNIERFHMMGIPVTAAFCATRYNYLDVEEVVKLGVNHGIKNIAIGEVLPFGDNTESLKFSQEEYREFVQLMEHVIHKYNPLVDIEYISEWGFLFSNQANRTSCSAMDRDMAILFDGKVSPCPFIRHENYIMGDILISEVKDIWQSVAAKQFRLHKNIGCSNDCVQYSTCMSGCKAPLANLGIPINIENTRCPISPVNRNRTNL